MNEVRGMRKGVATAALACLTGMVNPAFASDVADCGQAKDAASAIAACSRVVDAGTASREDLVAARVRRAGALASTGRHDDAIRDLDAVLVLQPRNAEAWANRGVLRVRQGKRDQALADMSEALAIEPRRAKTLFNRSVLLGERGDWMAARKDIDLSLAIDPSSHSAQAQRCWVEAVLATDLPKARTACDIALKARPDDANNYNNSGFVNFRMGRFVAASVDYDRAIARDQTMASSYYMRGLSDRAAGRDGDADVARGLALDPGVAKRYAAYGVPAAR
jgi:tetratricopeptide (TPR) repeat protein